LRVGYELGIVGLVLLGVILLWQFWHLRWYVRHTQGPAQQAFAAAWTAGKAMTREEAIAYALQSVNPPFVTAQAEGSDKETLPPRLTANQSLPNPLTARELEVLGLLAQGFN
jgi:hypothetical protein